MSPKEAQSVASSLLHRKAQTYRSGPWIQRVRSEVRATLGASLDQRRTRLDSQGNTGFLLSFLNFKSSLPAISRASGPPICRASMLVVFHIVDSDMIGLSISLHCHAQLRDVVMTSAIEVTGPASPQS